MKNPIAFPIKAANDINPTPYIIPVISRKVLLLSRFIYAWVSPSTIVGKISKIVHSQFNSIILNINSGAERKPTYAPVHRAHTGNCFPL